MKAYKRRQTLSGAVLVMVLTVMFVLIILLMAALTVVTTANQRIYTKYEENQAYYTARSALDVFSLNLLSDSTHYAVDSSNNQRTYDYTDDDGNEQTSPMKQGLALEFELYKIRSKNDAGFASNFLDSDGIFGAATVPENDNYSTADDYSDVTNTYDPFDGTKHDSIVYTVTLPTLSDGSNSYGKLVDTDASGQKATIRVEVLERHYDYGGANKDAFKGMTDAQLKTCSAGSVSYNGVTYTAAQLKDAISKGNRQKDRMKVKITSTATFIDTLGTAVLIYDVTEAPKTNSSQAITSMGGVTGSSGTFAIGGASALSDVSTVDNSVLVGDLYTDGNFTMVNSTDYLYFFKDTVYTIRGNWNIDSNSGYGKLAFKENGTVIYVTGRLSLGDAATFASPSAKANVVADWVTMTGNGTHSEAAYNGNFYCNTFEVATDNAGGPTVNGNVYTNDLVIDAFGAIGQSGGVNIIRISDSLSCLSKVTVSNGIVIGGNTYTFSSANTLVGYDPGTGLDGVTFTLQYGSTNLSDDPNLSPSNQFTYNSSAKVKMDYTDPTMYTMSSENKKQFTLPATLAGGASNKFEVPTAAFLYSEIFQPSTFVAKAPDEGANGEIDPNKPEYPEFEFTSLDTSGVTVLRDGPQPAPVYWGPGPVSPVHPECLVDIAKGIITDASDSHYGYDGNAFNIDKEFATEALKLAKANDTDYQQALADFYAVYITGAEKANETQSDLKVFSSEVTVIDSIPATDVELTAIATDIHATKMINSSGYIRIGDQHGNGTKSDIQSGGNSAAPVIIDARTAPITLQLGNGTGSGTFRGYYVVVGDQPVKVYLPDGIDDYYLGNSASGQGFFMTTYDLYKEMKSTTGTLKLGNDPNAMPSPNIFFYAGDNVKSVTVESEDSFIAGHIYFPFANYEYRVNDGYKFSSVTYNTFPISMTGGFHCIGSLICGSYKSGNKTGVAYISQDNSSYNAGEPQFVWLTTQYARN